jgi:hypothetical protein
MGVFAGRERELAGLRAALDGGSRLVLVAGDAGIGKTRFVTEGLQDTPQVWGACLPLAEKLPFLPVTEALDALSRIGDGALLAGALAAIPPYAQAEGARLLPHLPPPAVEGARPGAGPARADVLRRGRAAGRDRAPGQAYRRHRGRGHSDEIRLGPLSRDEIAEQVTAVRGAAGAGGVARALRPRRG